MEIIAAIPIVCWLCALIAMPRIGPNAEEERSVAYQLGRQRRVRIVAVITTMMLLLAAIARVPHGSDADLRALRDTQRICTNVAVGFATCYQHRADGSWWREDLLNDGTWVVVGTAPAPPPGLDAIRDADDAPH